MCGEPCGHLTVSSRFFQNMAPLSPILDDWYSQHENHYYLVAREPMLCCTILTISSRYHVLPVPGGESRGFLIHQRLWEHCQHLLMRILLGQEKGSKAKTRTLGSIEALLLLTEWQPRGLHVPPGSDGWDSDALFTLRTAKDEVEPEVDRSPRGRWLQDVLDPARRFDRMSWMALGAAVTLAHELSVFDIEEVSTEQPPALCVYEGRNKHRALALSSLLQAQHEQLSARLGRKSWMLQNSYSAKTFSRVPTHLQGPSCEAFLSAWIELTKLARSICDVLFSSALVTTQLLLTGRYVGLIEHFSEMLSAWEAKYLRNPGKPAAFRSEYSTNRKGVAPARLYDMLCMEYNHVRVHANSLGLQAIFERAAVETDPVSVHISTTDYQFVSNVVDSCLNVLRITTKLHQSGVLRFAPVSVFMRVTSASVFLLKGLGIGAKNSRLQEALGTLTLTIDALKASKPDDLHLGARYAELLETHLLQLQEKFVPAAKPPMFHGASLSVDRTMPQHPSADNAPWDTCSTRNGVSDMVPLQSAPKVCGTFDDSWLTLPFDPSLMSFAVDELQGLQGLGDDSLNFIWNLGPQSV